MQVEISKESKSDVKEISDYISRDSRRYAKETVDKIYEKIKILNDFPYIGRKVPEQDDERYRELIYKSYRIIYKIEKGYIHIQTVIHGARNVKNIFKFK